MIDKVELKPCLLCIKLLEDAVCEYMKMITLDKVLYSLENMQFEVKVSDEISAKAKLAIDRMVHTLEDNK